MCAISKTNGKDGGRDEGRLDRREALLGSKERLTTCELEEILDMVLRSTGRSVSQQRKRFCLLKEQRKKEATAEDEAVLSGRSCQLKRQRYPRSTPLINHFTFKFRN